MDRVAGSRVQLESVPAALPSGIAIIDEEGRQSWVNAAFARMVGWSPEELIGDTPPYRYWPPEEMDRIGEALERTVRGEGSSEVGYELRFMRRDGRRLDVLVAVGPIELEGGAKGWVASVIDLTRQKAAEAALQERDQRLALALAAGRLGSWEYDLGSDRVIWSSELERIHGLPEGSFGGTFEAYAADIHPDDRERVLATIERSAGGEIAHELEYRIVRPDGEVRWLEARGGLIPGSDGRPDRMIGICSDVTERKASEQAVRAARDEAERANQAKLEILGVVSHEMRNPLNAMAGYVELLESGVYGQVAPRQREALQRVQHVQKQLLALIRDILHFARVEAGRLEFILGDLPVGPLLAAMAPLVERQVQARGLRYEILPVPERVVARGDRERVEQVLLNLLSNAIKFTDPGGRVVLSCDADEEHVHLRVEDNGRGVEPERLGTIFEPFVQGHGGAHREQGVGLGLAISRDLAAGMGGTLTVVSRVGEGSAFTLRLPRTEAPSSPVQG